MKKQVVQINRGRDVGELFPDGMKLGNSHIKKARSGQDTNEGKEGRGMETGVKEKMMVKSVELGVHFGSN